MKVVHGPQKQIPQAAKRRQIKFAQSVERQRMLFVKSSHNILPLFDPFLLGKVQIKPTFLIQADYIWQSTRLLIFSTVQLFCYNFRIVIYSFSVFSYLSAICNAFMPTLITAKMCNNYTIYCVGLKSTYTKPPPTNPKPGNAQLSCEVALRETLLTGKILILPLTGEAAP